MEVLVAMLILAIGLLGLASLQTQSLKFNHDAYVRSQATILAAEIMDKMRADPPNPGTNDPWFDVAVPDLDDCDLNLALGSINDATPLMAMCFWQTNIQGLLPSGSGGIVPNPLDGTMFDITIQWSDRVTDNQADCEAGTLGGRVWDGVNNLCMVTQIWTVFPS